MRYITFTINTSMNDLLDELMLNSQEDVLELIKEMDKRAQSVDFTEHLRDYFVEEMMKEDELCQREQQKKSLKQAKKNTPKKTSEKE